MKKFRLYLKCENDKQIKKIVKLSIVKYKKLVIYQSEINNNYNDIPLHS